MDAAHAGLRRSAVVVLAVLGSLLATLAPTGPALADPAPAVAAAAPAGTSLAVTVAMVQPGGAPRDARTLQQVVDTLTGPVAAYWQQQSGGHLRIGIEAAHDWTSTTATCADLTSLVGEVSRGVDWNPGRRDGESLLVYVPETAPDCPRGWAEPATSEHRWSNRAVLVVRDATPSSLAAQLGRSFGLGSSDALRCDGSVEGSVEGTVAGTGDAAACDVVPEGDPYDLLGAAGVELGSLNAAHADRIQLLPAGQRRTVRVVDPVGTHRLSPISGSSGLRGLELVDRSGDSYWLEYRPAAGRDGWLAGPGNTRGVTAGVQVRLMARDDDTSLLLDGTPGPAAGRDADVSTALPSGTAVGLAGGDFTVRVSSVSAGSAEVVVSPAQGSRALSAAYEAQRQQGSLGEPTGPERCGLRAGGCSRVYASGTVAWSPATGAWAMDRDTGRRWRAAGAENGPLGYPLAEPDCDLPSSQGCRQAFQGGVVFASSYGTWPVWGAIRKKWEALGADGGPAGAPVSGEVCGLRGGGCYQQFEHGFVYWAPASRAAYVADRLMGAYGTRGWEAGPLGYPLADTVCGLSQGACVQQLQGGLLYLRHEWEGAHVVKGAIGKRYAAGGFETRGLGYPLTDEICHPSPTGPGCTQAFDGGMIAWSPAGGARLVRGAVLDRWRQLTAQNGPGWPVTEEGCGLVRGGCYQVFASGQSIHYSPATGAQPVRADVSAVWAGSGYERGPLGYPVAPACTDGRSVRQRFQGGVLSVPIPRWTLVHLPRC